MSIYESKVNVLCFHIHYFLVPARLRLAGVKGIVMVLGASLDGVLKE